MITLACCSDTHGQLPPSLKSSKIAAWLHGGDVYDGHDASRPIQPMRDWFEKLLTPLLLVRGNHDVDDPAGLFSEGHDITGGIYRVHQRLVVAGIGWAGKRYSELPSEDTLDSACSQLQGRLLSELNDTDHVILLTHYPADLPEFPAPPSTVAGGGYCCIGSLIESVKPLVVIQGHVHERSGLIHRTRINGRACTLIHPGPRGMLVHVDLDKERVTVEG